MDTKPTAPVLNTASPYGTNCIFAVLVPTSGDYKDYKNSVTPTNSGVTSTTGANGPRALFDSINDYLDYGASNAFLGDGTNGTTVIIGLKKSDATERDCQHFCVDSTTGNERFWASLPFVDGNCYFDSFGTGNGRNFCASGTEGDDVWILVSGPSGKHMWKNGSDLSSSATAAQVGTPTTAAFRIGKAANVQGGDLFELDYLIILNTEVTSSGDIATLFTDPVAMWRPVIPALSSATINAGATTLTLVWSTAVTDASFAATLSGQRKTIAVGALQSGDGTDTHVYALSPTGKIFKSALEAGTVAITIASGKVTAVSGGNPNATITAQSVTNNSTVIYTPAGVLMTYKVLVGATVSNEASGTIGSSPQRGGRGRYRLRRRW